VTDDTHTARPSSVSDQQQPRDEIMVAAKKVFARNSFHATTIADVAKEAGLPFGAIYQYFDSKDVLFHALIAAEEYALRTHVAVALAQSGAQLDTLRRRFAPHCGRHSSSSTPTGPPPSCCSAMPMRWTTSSTSGSADLTQPARARTHNGWSASFAPGRNFTGVAN
jgi:AcrR family transcriptional regulator